MNTNIFQKIIFILIPTLILFGCKPVDIGPVDPRDKFLGKWKVTEFSYTLNKTTTYTINIDKTQELSDSIIIYNFYNGNLNAVALVSGYKLQIPSQILKTYQTDGIGSLSNDKILTLTYLVTGADPSSNVYDDCMADCVK